MAHFALHIPNFNQGRVLVVGDVMLDNFVYGEVSRISPEAPIPVLSVSSEKCMAGGAANVALNAAALGANTNIIGIVGADEAGQKLKHLLGTARASASADLVSDRSRPTSLKTRYIGNKQQILRADRETTTPASREVEDALIAKVETHLAAADVVALSDYGKGALTDRVLTETIRLSRKAKVPVIVDPKRANWDIYKGASVIKPNLQELSRATGLDCSREAEADRAAIQIVDKLNVALLLTRSQNGMSIYRKDHAPVHAHAAQHEVFDVSGAGDTALAAFAAAIAAHASVEDAMYLANIASGVAVTKLGTAIVTADELAHACVSGSVYSGFERVLSPERAAALCHLWKARGLKVGFTNGCFDILHAGHVSMLAKAAAKCDRLVVALNSDASVKRLKGPGRPVQGEASRTKVIAALEATSVVTVFDEDTPLELIRLIKPDVLFKGADYTEDQVVGGELVKAWGGEVALIDLVPELSTTNAIKRARGLT